MMFDIEHLSFLEIARRELNTEKLPEKIRDGLNTIFTKKAKAGLYRPKIINEKVTDQKQNKHPIKLGKKNSVYNVLIIWYLFNSDTGKTKNLLQEYAKNGICNETLNELIDLTKKQYLEFFCLGVIRENIQEIIKCLNSSSFDLFSERLPSPFSENKGNTFDITPMLAIYSQDIPWESYMSQYQIAEEFFTVKNFKKAKEVLKNLEVTSLIRLPVIEALNKKIIAIEAETKDAWDYFQNALN